MTTEEIVHGESKNVEFKMTVPNDSEEYAKTVVAFANTHGGKLIISVKRIISAAESYGLPAPEFQVFDDMFRVNLFRKVISVETSEKHRRSVGNDLNDTQKKILELLSQDEQLSAKKIAVKIGISSRNIEFNIKKLKECGALVRHGSPKNGYWEIMK